MDGNRDLRPEREPAEPIPAPLGFWGRCVARVRDAGAEVMGRFHRFNDRMNQSTFGRIFRLKGSGHPDEIHDANFSTELRAGLTTFATMAYIIAVNASIVSNTGATCFCDRSNGSSQCSNQPEYSDCVTEVQQDLITATAALSGTATIVFGLLTNMPVALAPGMGLNAYFTYQVVGINGTGPVPYRLALTAVFVEGFVFMFLALTGMRQWLVKIIPGTLKTASGVGIGLFLALTGMSYNAGIGLVTPGATSPMAIAGCPQEDLDPNSGACRGHAMTNPKLWLGVLGGGLLTAFLMAFRIKAAIVIGMAFVTVLSWPRDTSVSYFPHNREGDERFAFFKQGVAFQPIQHILGVQQWDLSGETGTHFLLALITFLYVDIVDCTATLYSMARFSGKTRSSDGDFPRSTIAYCTDAAFITVGSFLGCSPITAFIESGAGIAEGGRTGITAITCGVCFLFSIFLAPIFASIPPWASGCTLILVGCLMMRQVTCCNWSYIGDAVPSFVTIAVIPFSYSVAYGLMAGAFVYTVLNGMIWLVIKITGGAIEPREYDLKEYWTWKPGGRKPWLFNLFNRRPIWPDRRSNSSRDDDVALREVNEGHSPPVGGSQSASGRSGAVSAASATSSEKGNNAFSTPPARPHVLNL